MVQLYLTPIGIVIEKDGVFEIEKFGENLKEIALNLYNFCQGNYELDELVNRIDKEEVIIVKSKLLYSLLSRYSQLSEKLKLEEKGISVSQLLIKIGVVRDASESMRMIKEVLLNLSEEKLKIELANRDQLVIHAINSYDEYTETINLFYERLREWYGTYFPELDNIVTKIDSYTNLIQLIGFKEEYKSETLQKLGYGSKKIEQIVYKAISSKGGMLKRDDIDMIKAHASTLRQIIKTREKIENYLEELLNEIAPNITALVGSKLAARLIAKAGGLKKLAMFPASTIQLLGAEKALFLALKKGRNPPKHGVIFQHPFINQSPKIVRGRIARILAGKLSIASRVDAFGGDYIGDKLLKDLRIKVEEIRRAAKMLKRKRSAKTKIKRRKKRR